MDIKEKIETIDHLLHVTFKKDRDRDVLKSIVEDMADLLNKMIDDYLKRLKENKEINVLPQMKENKLKIFVKKLNKDFSQKEIERMEILLIIKNNNLIKEKYSNLEDAENFYKLIKKIYDLLFN
ncbi:MAG TPA: hypothetical protein EYH54_05650 [Nautiliaceae bacterium]|nr:hypothetical protein [Nautiliaceae bacterium]